MGEGRHLFVDVKDALKILLLRIEQGRKRTGKKDKRFVIMLIH